jgi:hypothetical protein
VVPIEFVILDAETDVPVQQARLRLSTRGGLLYHTLVTGPDGRARLAFQPRCGEHIYAFWGFVYTVHYSDWVLDIEAERYETVGGELSKYRGNTSYPQDVVPPAIVIRIKRRTVIL